MMGERRVAQEHLFYEFSLERHVPETHLLRSIDRFVELGGLRRELAPFYSEMGRPSIDPELLIRMLIVGYCFGIRSERRLCEEVHLNLAYRWFCRLGLEDGVPEHSTFPKNRHGRFRDSDAFRHVFETVLQRCIAATDPAAEWTCAPGGPAFFAYSTNYLVDVRAGVIVDVEATSAHRNREVDATRTMIERTEERFALKPKRSIGDMAYGAGPMLGWLVDTKQIEPHIPVWDKSERTDGSISSSEFVWDEAADEYRCPEGRPLRREWRAYSNPRTHITKAETIIYRSRAADCANCPLKSRCCPNTQIRKIARSVYEAARNVARTVARTRHYRQSRRARKKVEMLFAHLKRILKLDRLRLRGPERRPRRVPARSHC